ncbi:MAG: glycosyltransferase [Ferrovum myxofaciens]
MRKAVRISKICGGFLVYWASDPKRFLPSLKRLLTSLYGGGITSLKQTIINILVGNVDNAEVWESYVSSQSKIIVRHVEEKLRKRESFPLISVIMPTYNTPREILMETLDSVVGQLYPHWELCVADDGSTKSHVREILEKYAALDSRIHLNFHSFNTGTSAASNRALAMAQGTYVALLDHDDKLEKQALFRISESVLEDEPDMIYSDEALISQDGRCVTSFTFRPAFSMEFLRSHPYIVHFVSFRTELLRELEGFNESLAISQDYDLILRVTEKARKIVHIPEVLYLWRQLPNSSGHKQYDQVMTVSTGVINNHLSRCGENAYAVPSKSFNFFETCYPLKKGLNVAIIIPTKNHHEILRVCIESIERTVVGVDYDIVVVDHESENEGSIEYFNSIRERHKIIEYKGEFNFSEINNFAVKQLHDGYSHYLFCNNDIEAIKEGWLVQMLELFQNEDVGIVGANLFYPDGKTYQHAGVCVGMSGPAEHFGKFVEKYLPGGSVNIGYNGNFIANHEVSAVTGACLLISGEAFDSVSGYDPSLAVGFGDVDLCLRVIDAGYRVVQCSRAALIHHESFTRGKSLGHDEHPQDTEFFKERWAKLLEVGDPYFNPNLNPDSTCWKVNNPLVFNKEIKRRIFSRTRTPVSENNGGQG